MRAAGCVTFFWLVGSEVTGWESVLNLKLPSSTWVRALVAAEELKDTEFCSIMQDYVYPLSRNQDLAALPHSCFLTALPLFLHPLTSLISNCLNLFFGTQGMSRRLKEAYLLQIRNRGHKGSCLVSVPCPIHFFHLAVHWYPLSYPSVKW